MQRHAEAAHNPLHGCPPDDNPHPVFSLRLLLVLPQLWQDPSILIVGPASPHMSQFLQMVHIDPKRLRWQGLETLDLFHHITNTYVSQGPATLAQGVWWLAGFSLLHVCIWSNHRRLAHSRLQVCSAVCSDTVLPPG